ncbi:MAG: carboxypeptidase-like regulatory domain-containing protein [Planctomycetota bacterium]
MRIAGVLVAAVVLGGAVLYRSTRPAVSESGSSASADVGREPGPVLLAAPNGEEAWREAVGARVRIVDSDGVGVPATVTVLYADWSREVRTTADGTLVLGAGRRAAMKVEADGHVPAGLLFGGADQTIALDPAASLEIAFARRDGGGVGGIEVELRPGHRGGSFVYQELFEGAERRGSLDAVFDDLAAFESFPLPPRNAQVSGDDGVARWAGLVPGRYRYHLPEPGPVQLSPPHEADAVTWRDGDRSPLPPRAPAGLSGEFDVELGANGLSVLVAPACSLAGRVLRSDGEPVPDATIELYSSKRYVRAEQRVVSDRVERLGSTDADGFFSLLNLSAGAKRLEVRFSFPEGQWRHWGLLSRELSLAPGEGRDLGDLIPQGPPIRGAISFVNGTEPIAWEAVAEPSTVTADIDALPVVGRPMTGFHTTQEIELRVGQEFVLHGLAWEHYKLRLRAADVALREPWSHERRTILDFPFDPADGFLAVQLPVHRPAEIQLTAALPSGFRRGQVDGFLIGEHVVHKFRFELGPRIVVGGVEQPLPEALSTTLRVAPGGYRLVVTQPQHDDPTDGGWYAESHVTVTAGESAQTFDVKLEPGARVAGVLRGADAAGRSLAFTFPHLEARQAWIFQTATENDGSFTAKGLPFATTLVERRTRTTFSTSVSFVKLNQGD